MDGKSVGKGIQKKKLIVGLYIEQEIWFSSPSSDKQFFYLNIGRGVM